jgi:hypothetical protein
MRRLWIGLAAAMVGLAAVIPMVPTQAAPVQGVPWKDLGF